MYCNTIYYNTVTCPSKRALPPHTWIKYNFVELLFKELSTYQLVLLIVI